MTNRIASVIVTLTAVFSGLPAYALDDIESQIENGAVLGLGARNLASVSLYSVFSHAHEDAADTDPSSSYGIHMELAGLPIFTLHGGFFGVEAEGTFGLPWNYFGGLNLSGGILVRPFRIPIIQPSLGFGVGFGSHYYGYIQPRLAANFGIFDVEFTCMWIPQYASHILGEGGLTESGIGHLRFRGSLFIPLGEPTELVSFMFVRVFVERHRFAGDPQRLIDKEVVPGDYWGGGLGFGF